MVKRGRPSKEAASAKKAKVVDPLAEKVDLVSETISDPLCQVPGPELHREMLVNSIPYTLTVASEERHEWQTAVAKMVGEVLSGYVVDWEKQVSDSLAEIGATELQAKQSMDLVEESVQKIHAHEEVVAKSQELKDEAVAAAKFTGDNLKSAATEVAEFDGQLQMVIDQKDHCGSIYNDCFIPMKSGTSQAASHIKKIEPMLKKLSTESSLLSAIAPALKKLPDERGAFDIMAVEGTEAIFTKHLGALQDQIDTADGAKAEKVSVEAAAQQARNAAVERRTECEAVLTTAESDLKTLEKDHKKLLKAANTTSLNSHDSLATQVTKEEGLAEAKRILSVFKELLERTAPQEPAADISMVEEEQANPAA